MNAIIQTAGKQYYVKEGDTIFLDKDLLPTSDRNVEFKEILAAGEEGKLEFGNPFLGNVKVIGEVLDRGKGKKVTIYKSHKRKRYSRKKGHRQPLTKIRIVKIEKI